MNNQQNEVNEVRGRVFDPDLDKVRTELTIKLNVLDELNPLLAKKFWLRHIAI